MKWWHPREDLSRPKRDFLRGWFHVEKGGDLPVLDHEPPPEIADYFEVRETPGDQLGLAV
jgi:hypothetical protein